MVPLPRQTSDRRPTEGWVMKLLPAKIFVFLEKDDDDDYLVPVTSLDECAPGVGEERLVGVYGLLEVKKITSKAVEIVDKKTK